MCGFSNSLEKQSLYKIVISTKHFHAVMLQSTDIIIDVVCHRVFAKYSSNTKLVFLQPGRDGGSSVVCGLNVVLGVADTAFACVFALTKYSPWGIVYTSIR